MMSASLHNPTEFEAQELTASDGRPFVLVRFSSRDGQIDIFFQNLTQAMDGISGLLQQLGNFAYNRRVRAGELDDNDRADDDRGMEQERLALDDDPRDVYAEPGERFYE